MAKKLGMVISLSLPPEIGYTVDKFLPYGPSYTQNLTVLHRIYSLVTVQEICTPKLVCLLAFSLRKSDIHTHHWKHEAIHKCGWPVPAPG